MTDWGPPSDPNGPRLPEPTGTPRLPDPDPGVEPTTEQAKRPLWKRKIVWIPGVSLIALLVLGAVLPDPDDDDHSATSTMPAPTTSSPTPTTAQAPTTMTIEEELATIVVTTTTAPTTTTPIPDGPPQAATAALSRLATLTVSEPEPDREPYNRDEYHPGGWGDADGDCISTRHEVLIAQSLSPVTMSDDGCRVESGEWVDPYSGDVMTTAEEATINHFIPLAEGHRSGAWKWDADSKVWFTNDETPGALFVVAGDVNQSKADNTPDKWLPPLAEPHCAYAINWVDMKSRWGLTVTQSEHDTLVTLIEGCTSSTAPEPADVPAATVTVTLPTLPPTTTTIAPSAGPAEVVLLSCDARDEEVVIANRGGEPADLNGYMLHDFESRHSTPLDEWSPLAPSSTLTVLTGPDASPGPGEVLWKNQNVWNNDGDTAYLVGPTGEQTARC